MKYVSICINYLAAIIIILALIANIGLSLYEGDFFIFISLRNIFLYFLLFCFIVKNKFSLLLLMTLTILFWFEFFQLRITETYFTNPILYYTNTLYSILKVLNYRHNFFKFIIVIPFYLNLIVTFFEIPYRLFLNYSNKKTIHET